MFLKGHSRCMKNRSDMPVRGSSCDSVQVMTDDQMVAVVVMRNGHIGDIF